MSDSQFFTRFHFSHRAGDSWHPLVEIPPADEVGAADQPTLERGRVFRCAECDLEIIAAGELWQEGTLDW